MYLPFDANPKKIQKLGTFYRIKQSKKPNIFLKIKLFIWIKKTTWVSYGKNSQAKNPSGGQMQ